MMADQMRTVPRCAYIHLDINTIIIVMGQYSVFPTIKKIYYYLGLDRDAFTSKCIKLLHIHEITSKDIKITRNYNY